MDRAALNTITDVETLRALVIENFDAIAQRDEVIAQRNETIQHHLAALAERDRAITYKDAKIARLTHEIARLRRVQFAAKSERMDPAQRELFDEAMAADIAALEAELDALREPATTPKAPRKSVRRTLPADRKRPPTSSSLASSELLRSRVSRARRRRCRRRLRSGVRIRWRGARAGCRWRRIAVGTIFRMRSGCTGSAGWARRR